LVVLGAVAAASALPEPEKVPSAPNVPSDMANPEMQPGTIYGAETKHWGYYGHYPRYYPNYYQSTNYYPNYQPYNYGHNYKGFKGHYYNSWDD
jgi:hypothetical protein